MQFSSFRMLMGILVMLGTVSTTSALYYLDWRRNPDRVLGLGARILQCVSILYVCNYVFTIFRWISYRPRPGIQEDWQLPKISVFIPAYNESVFVKGSMESVGLSDYPRDKIQLICIDDGSTDDTWDHMQDAAAGPLSGSGMEITLLRHGINMGKRQAVVTGFKAAKHEIIVSLDSDSVLEPQSLRNLISPIATEKDIGGVAGHLLALNVVAEKPADQWRVTIPRILNILFESVGNIPRSAQDKSGFVTILPGAISAYRRSAVMPKIEQLVSRTFLGHPLRHGEDVEITLNLLVDNWRTVYQSNAPVHTTVPETPYRAFLMFTRWERSSFVYFVMGLLHLALVQTISKSMGRVPANSRRQQELQQQQQQQQRMDDARRSPVEGRTKKDDDDVFPKAPSLAISMMSYLAAGNPLANMDLYPVSSLLCVVLSNLLFIVTLLSRVGGTMKHPSQILGDLLCICVFATCNSLVFVADGTEEESAAADAEDVEKSPSRRWWRAAQAADGGVAAATTTMPQLCNKSERMVWNVQYSAFSAAFQFFFVSWTSVLGLATIRSQSWLTR